MPTPQPARRRRSDRVEVLGVHEEARIEAADGVPCLAPDDERGAGGEADLDAVRGRRRHQLVEASGPAEPDEVRDVAARVDVLAVGHRHERLPRPPRGLLRRARAHARPAQPGAGTQSGLRNSSSGAVAGARAGHGAAREAAIAARLHHDGPGRLATRQRGRAVARRVVDDDELVAGLELLAEHGEDAGKLVDVVVADQHHGEAGVADHAQRTELMRCSLPTTSAS